MNPMSSRHEGDFGGPFVPLGQSERTDVTVVVAPDHAAGPAVQHCAWMLVNLLARYTDMVGRVGVISPTGMPLAGRIVPLARRDADLRSALLEGGAAIGGVPVLSGDVGGIRLIVGAATARNDGLYVYGDGWAGGVSTTPRPFAPTSDLPFGPYIAACIAAGEVFRTCRMAKEAYIPLPSCYYSTWDNHLHADLSTKGPSAITDVTLNVGLAGVGAVGCAWVHTLWACPGIAGEAVLADSDPKGIDHTNLNRYCLFGTSSLGTQKAHEAAAIAADARITWHPHRSPIERLQVLPPVIVSAVDNNRARAAIQRRYPATILSASTLGVRAEVLVCGPPGEGACLACYNPPEKVDSDDEIRARLRACTDEELAAHATAIGSTVEEVLAWVASGSCGNVGDRVMAHIRESADSPGLAAVGFVSVMAGVIVAAATVKQALHRPDEGQNRAVFQFVNPGACRVNRPGFYKRDTTCSLCRPGTEADTIWKRRYAAARQAGSG